MSSVYVITEDPHHESSTILAAATSLEDAKIVAEGYLSEREIRGVTPWISGTDQQGHPTWWLGDDGHVVLNLFITELVPVGPVPCERCGKPKDTFACRIKHQHLNTGWAKSANDR